MQLGSEGYNFGSDTACTTLGGMTDSPDTTTTTTVRALATARGMTHIDVAEAIGVHRSRFERRLANGGWTLEETVALAELFGVTLDELTTGLGGTLTPGGGGQ